MKLTICTFHPKEHTFLLFTTQEQQQQQLASTFLFFRLPRLCSRCSSSASSWVIAAEPIGWCICGEVREREKEVGEKFLSMKIFRSLLSPLSSCFLIVPCNLDACLITRRSMHMELTYENKMCDAPVIGVQWRFLKWYAKNFSPDMKDDRLRRCLSVITWKFHDWKILGNYKRMEMNIYGFYLIIKGMSEQAFKFKIFCKSNVLEKI